MSLPALAARGVASGRDAHGRASYVRISLRLKISNKIKGVLTAVRAAGATEETCR